MQRQQPRASRSPLQLRAVFFPQPKSFRPAGKGFSNLKRAERGARRPRSVMQDQDAAASVEETVGFYGQRRGPDDEVRRCREHWPSPADEKQRLRAGSSAARPQTTHDREVRAESDEHGGWSSNGSKVQEKYQQEWTNELQKGGPGRGAEAGSQGDEEAERRRRTLPLSPGLGPGSPTRFLLVLGSSVRGTCRNEPGQRYP